MKTILILLAVFPLTLSAQVPDSSYLEFKIKQIKSDWPCEDDYWYEISEIKKAQYDSLARVYNQLLAQYVLLNFIFRGTNNVVSKECLSDTVQPIKEWKNDCYFKPAGLSEKEWRKKYFEDEQ